MYKYENWLKKINKIILLILITYCCNCICNNEFCYLESNACDNIQNRTRYLFYDINPPEGFNLRRDVYMRFAILANKLKNSRNENLNNFKLVLPSWSKIYHWTYSETPEHIPWSLFFDLPSLKLFAPVIEIHEFFTISEKKSKYSKIIINEVYTLQHFEDMFETGNFIDKFQIDKCLKNYPISYFFYENITSNNIQCLSFHGSAVKLTNFLSNSSAESILINRAEVVLHDTFGDNIYWQARRSMRFNKELREIAKYFRKKYLNSTDESDNTFLPENWLDEKPKRNAIGGPYLSVHLRRGDFLRGRSDEIPSIESICKQISKVLNLLDLKTVFIATDATSKEYEEITERLSSNKYKIFRYIPTEKIKASFRDGGIAIIDQIICSYARYFIGTHESTFSFRIQEEREILGFPVDSTFNCFCKDNKHCKKPSIWKIVY